MEKKKYICDCGSQMILGVSYVYFEDLKGNQIHCRGSYSDGHDLYCPKCEDVDAESNYSD